MTYVVTADAQGNLQCAAPIESVLQQSTSPVVTAVDVSYTASSGNLSVSVQDVTGAVKQDSVTLPTSTQNISTWSNGTTQAIVLGSNGKLYLANPTGAPSTHNPVNKTNNVDWFGAFTTVNDLLQYALSGGSFLAGSGTSTTTSAAPPANPVLGAEWWTTSATAAPYAKNTLYKYNGTSWAYVAGRPETVATSAGVRDSAMGVGTRFSNIDLSAYSDGLNATTTADGIIVPESGVYHIEAAVNPGSVYTTHATNNGGLAFYTLEIHVNGTLFASTTQNVFINGVGDTIDPATLGTACNTFLTINCNAGDIVEPIIYITGLELSYSVTLKVARVG